MVEDLRTLAELGEKIYRETYKVEYERLYPGRFVAIDVVSERAFVGEKPETTLSQARDAEPNGRFHLIRVGSPGVYRVGYSRGGRDGDWVFRG